MKTWEYKRVVFGGTHKTTKYHWLARDIDSGIELWSLEGEYELLTWLGLDGWELTTITDQEHWIFKREVCNEV